MTRPNARLRLSPPPPPGVPASAFKDTITVPVPLVRLVGPPHAFLLAVLCGWWCDPDGTQIRSGANGDRWLRVTSTDWSSVGVNDEQDIRESLELLSSTGMLSVLADPPTVSEDGSGEERESTTTYLVVHLGLVASLVNAAIEQEHQETPDMSPEDAQRLAETDRLCRLLADLVEVNGMPRPTITETWLSDMDKIMRIDSYQASAVEKAILWCQADAFWHKNIRSPGKLREKFSTLRERAAERPPLAREQIARGRTMLASLGARPKTAPADPFTSDSDNPPDREKEIVSSYAEFIPKDRGGVQE